MKRVAFVFVLFISMNHLLATDFSEKQKAIIYNEAIKIVKSYQVLSNQIADDVMDIDAENKNSQKLIDLFVNRKAIIYNDLDPLHQLSEVYELETYVANLLLWYPDGMKIAFDFENLKAGNIIDHGNDIYTVDIMTSKKIDGNYLNKQTNNLTEELLYRIAFFEKGNSFESFKIAGVRSSKSTIVTDDSHILSEVKSVDFSEKDMQQIKDQSKSLLNDYINFLNLLADPKESDEDKGFYRISFLGLFKDSTLKVANDIDPESQERWVSVNEYQEDLVRSYPDGIRNLAMNMDSAEYGKVIPEGNETYYINGYINKFFSGKYQNKVVYRDNAKYDFKLSFVRDDNTFKDFKLSSIDKFGINLYEQNKVSAVQELPQQRITTLRRNGLYTGLSVSAGRMLFSDPNLTDDPILLWKKTNKSALSINAHATWYLYNQWGINAGIEFDHFATSFSLNGEFQNTIYFTDFNNETYLKNVTAAYDSLVTFNYLSIPISISYYSNKNPETWGFYAETGLVTSFLLGSGFKATGSMATSGYYEQYPESMQTINTAEYGFVSRTQIEESGKTDTKKIQMSVLASVGVTYPLDYYTTIFAGPEWVWGLTNLSNNSDFVDAFGNITQAKKVGISRFGVKFGISYKF